MEIFQLAAVGELAGQRLEALEVEQAAAHVVAAGLRDDVDDTTRRAAEFGRRAGRDDLKLLHRVERDVDRGALSARLLAEEPVVVVAAVEADVVEHAALAGKRDLIAIRPLHDAHAGGQRQEIFELASENRQRADDALVECRRDAAASRLDDRRAGHGDGFLNRGHLQARRQVDRLADRQHHAFLDDGGEAL